MHKIIKMSSLILIILVFISGCGYGNPEKVVEKDIIEAVPIINYNHAGNLINDGILTKKDDWLYYSNFNDGGKIYKVHADVGEHIKVNNEQSSKMTIIGDWIYYLGRGGNVYKIRTDGSERTLLFDDYSWELLVFDDWIYHTSSSYGIFKLQTNGSEHKEISGDPGSYFHLVDDWLYYCYEKLQSCLRS